MNEESLLKLSPDFEKLLDILAIKKPRTIPPRVWKLGTSAAVSWKIFLGFL